MGRPSVYPTGVTLYDKDKACNGYTLFPSKYGITLMDMNGRIVKVWEGLSGAVVKMLPDASILCSRGQVPGGPAGAGSYAEAVVADWNGNITWSYSNNQPYKKTDGTVGMAAKHHHDMEFENYPVYYSPDMDKGITEQRCLLLTHNYIRDIKISDSLLLDERIIEVDMEGKLLWEWNAHEHIDEYGLSNAARKALFGNPMNGGDWIHLNAVSTLGNNHFYDEGDERFNPENILCSSRQMNCVFIIEKLTGNIVWRLGPDVTESPNMQKVGQIIGQHHVHMIPRGLPGEGNILMFDNGSFGGYGTPNGMSPDGTDVLRRHYSRALEINPVTMEIVWEYSKAHTVNGKVINPMNAHQFFSPYISSVQRLENGNTLITQGADGLVIEVTPEKEIVWEFVNPFFDEKKPPLMRASIYRSFRIPYDWIPLGQPEEKSIVPPKIEEYRVPGACPLGDVGSVTTKVTDKRQQ